MADSSQKFVARNRAPRVQIEYDVELYGSEKKVQLPFVMGVMSDLTGKSKQPQPAIADRKFLEIDVDNFDERMRSMAPRAAFNVPNTLTGEGNIAVDLTFESMADFTPGAIASKVDALRPLLEARQQLEQLMTYMDGKSGAEELIEKILKSPALLSSLAGETDEARAEGEAALQGLREIELPVEDLGPTHQDVLGTMEGQVSEELPSEDPSIGILAGLSGSAPNADTKEDDTRDILTSLASTAPEDKPAATGVAETLSDLAAAAPETSAEEDRSQAVLSSLAEQRTEVSEEDRSMDDALNALGDSADADIPDTDTAAEILGSLTPPATAEDINEGDGSAEVLAELATQQPLGPGRAC